MAAEAGRDAGARRRRPVKAERPEAPLSIGVGAVVVVFFGSADDEVGQLAVDGETERQCAAAHRYRRQRAVGDVLAVGAEVPVPAVAAVVAGQLRSARTLARDEYLAAAHVG